MIARTLRDRSMDSLANEEKALPNLGRKKPSLNQSLKDIMRSESKSQLMNLPTFEHLGRNQKNLKSYFISYLNTQIAPSESARKIKHEGKALQVVPFSITGKSNKADEFPLAKASNIQKSFAQIVLPPKEKLTQAKLEARRLKQSELNSNNQSLLTNAKENMPIGMKKPARVNFFIEFIAKAKHNLLQMEEENSRSIFQTSDMNNFSRLSSTQRKTSRKSDKIACTSNHPTETFRQTSFTKIGLFKKRQNINVKNMLYNIMSEPKKIEKKSKPRPNPSKSYAIFPSMNNLEVFKIPQNTALKAAEFSTMVYVEDTKSPYLLIFGGLNSHIHHEFVIYHFENETIETKAVSNQDQISRFGHTMNIIRNTAYIYGGTNSFQSEIYINKNVNFNLLNPKFFSLNLSNWSTKEIKSSSFQHPVLRKFHASFVLDDTYLCIYGGVKHGDKFLRDFWIFDVEEETWIEFRLGNEVSDFGIEVGIAHHRMVSLSSTITHLVTDGKINSDEALADPKSKVAKIINLFNSEKKHIALDTYMFGGINAKNEVISNYIFQLMMKNNHFYFKKLDNLFGSPPEARHSHTMTSMGNRDIVVYGGRNENNCFLSSMHLLNTAKKMWTKCDVVNNEWKGGVSSHSAAIFDKVLLIFGGIHNKGFMDANIYYLNFP
jgi:hypothetical protein